MITDDENNEIVDSEGGGTMECVCVCVLMMTFLLEYEQTYVI